MLPERGPPGSANEHAGDREADHAVLDIERTVAERGGWAAIHVAASQILERIELMINLAELADLSDDTRQTLERARAEAERAMMEAARSIRQH